MQDNEILKLLKSQGSGVIAIANKTGLGKTAISMQFKRGKLTAPVQKEVERVLGYSLVDLITGKAEPVKPVTATTKPKEAKEQTSEAKIPSNIFEVYKNLKISAGVSDNTKKNFDKSIGRFFKWDKAQQEFTKDIHPQNVYFNSDDLIEYLNQFPGNENGYANRHFHWRNLREFYKYVAGKYHITNPIQHEENGKTVYDVPEPYFDKNSVEASITEAEVKAILNSDEIDARDKLMVSLPFYSSMRLSEWMNLNVDDINYKTKGVTVRVKGQKTEFRTIAGSMPYLKAYLEETGIESGRLFQSTKQYKAITSTRGIEHHFERQIQPIARKLTGNKDLKLTPHVFRRGYAQMTQAHGINDIVAMTLGGWSEKSVRLYKKYGNALKAEKMGELLEQQLGLVSA